MSHPSRAALVALFAVCAAALAVLLPRAASALLLDGETVRVTWQFNANPPLFQQDVVVGPGIEIPGFPQKPSIRTLADIDLSDSSILITFLVEDLFSAGTFNGLIFEDVLSSIPPITNVTIDPSSTALNFGFGRLSYTANSVLLNFQFMEFQAQETIKLNLNPQPIPEPGTGVLAGLGLLLLGLRRRRS